ncbi:MAG TPA: lysophospholipid acyltransferase family protein [Fimbriimonadaceae bacterium]|nr:lysophospholipid acyltransferase family protein [Fimbriimonadaceae bacterium]
MSEHRVIPVSMMLRAGRVKRWREGRGRTSYPPLDTHFSVSIAWRFLRRILWRAARVKEVQIEGLDHLTGIKGQRAVITPNHPTNLDPLVMFHLSRVYGEPLNYLASRESFSVPVVGWILQKCGAYSIMRGTVDRQAIKTTRSLLAEKSRKIVMFPEGLTYGQNDVLMPFHEGVAQFGFWALEDMAKAGVDAPMWYVPVGIRYAYMRDMSADVTSAVSRLEEYIGIVPPKGESVYERLRAVGTSVVEGFEKAYGVRPEKGDTLDARIARMKDAWVSRTATAVGVEDKPEIPLGDRVRAVINALDRMNFAQDASEFTKQTMRRRHQETAPLYKDMERAGRFLATGARYVADDPSDERYLEVISRIEEELFGFSQMRGPRRAVVTVGEPIDLRQYLDEYRGSSRSTVTIVTRVLEERVRELVGTASQR